jgi:hypothetical protein
MTGVARTSSPAPVVRAALFVLVDEAGAKICSASIIVANDRFPEVVMFNGDPHIATDTLGVYRRVRPLRLDIGA